MWRWIVKRRACREGQVSNAGSEVSRLRMDLLEAERLSAAAGICTPGHFDRNAKASSQPALRRALEFFVASSPSEEFLEPWAVNRSLLVYLRGVHPVSAVLTIGWYEVGGRPVKKHSFETAERAVRGPDFSPRRRVVHAWVTTRAFEIVDVCLPAILDPDVRRSSHRNTAFYFPSPAAHDLITYHPTAIVEEALSDERVVAPRSAVMAHAGYLPGNPAGIAPQLSSGPCKSLLDRRET
jgi:hypothetical protein